MLERFRGSAHKIVFFYLIPTSLFESKYCYNLVVDNCVLEMYIPKKHVNEALRFRYGTYKKECMLHIIQILFNIVIVERCTTSPLYNVGRRCTAAHLYIF